jgi:hypothetical protein
MGMHEGHLPIPHQLPKREEGPDVQRVAHPNSCRWETLCHGFGHQPTLRLAHEQNATPVAQEPPTFGQDPEFLAAEAQRRLGMEYGCADLSPRFAIDFGVYIM